MTPANVTWLLAQTFWVGGLWLLEFVVLPAMKKTGLAPLLISSLADGLKPLLLGFAGFCVCLQGILLCLTQGRRALLGELRGQLLLVALLLIAAYFLVCQLAPDAQRWLAFNYTVVAMCGLLLVLQPLPSWASRR